MFVLWKKNIVYLFKSDTNILKEPHNLWEYVPILVLDINKQLETLF